MNLAAALIYWVIVALWLTILGTIIFFYVTDQQTAKAICGRRCQQEARLLQPPS